MCVELEGQRLLYEVERPVSVTYRDRQISGQRIDLVVGKLIVVELKSVVKLDEIHRAQLISYMRTLKLRGGLLINFRVALLKHGIRRVVL
jgi:GxxExxY protein